VTELDWGSLQKEAATAGVLPDGEYDVICYESTATTSSNGKPMIKVKLRVTAGPAKDKPIYSQFTVSAENAIALRIFFQHMAAFGLDSNFFGQNPPMDVVAKNLLNRGVRVTLDQREWNGTMRNNVAGVAPLPAGGPTVPGLVVGPPSAMPTAGSPIAPPAVTPAGPTSTPTASTTPAPPATPATPF
jgi:hypothetical protein